MSQKEPRPLYQRRIAYIVVLLIGLCIIVLVIYNFATIGAVDIGEFSSEWGIRSAAFDEDPIGNFPLFLQNMISVAFFAPALINPIAPYVVWLIMGLFLCILNLVNLFKTFSK